MIDLIKDLWLFMRERKEFWLTPIIVVHILLGGLIFPSMRNIPFSSQAFQFNSGFSPDRILSGGTTTHSFNQLLGIISHSWSPLLLH